MQNGNDAALRAEFGLWRSTFRRPRASFAQWKAGLRRIAEINSRNLSWWAAPGPLMALSRQAQGGTGKHSAARFIYRMAARATPRCSRLGPHLAPCPSQPRCAGVRCREEFQQRALGSRQLVPPDPAPQGGRRRRLHAGAGPSGRRRLRSSAPDSIDWTVLGGVSSVKDQVSGENWEVSGGQPWLVCAACVCPGRLAAWSYGPLPA